MEIRELMAGDISSVLEIQREAYIPELLESADTFLNRLNLFPQGALGCFLENHLSAYIFFHPWIKDRIVPLDKLIDRLPPDADSIYLHDLAVGSGFRRRDLGRKLIDNVFQLGDKLGIRWYSLVAVQSSERYWQRYGFQSIGGVEYAENVRGTIMTLDRRPPVS